MKSPDHRFARCGGSLALRIIVAVVGGRRSYGLPRIGLRGLLVNFHSLDRVLIFLIERGVALLFTPGPRRRRTLPLFRVSEHRQQYNHHDGDGQSSHGPDPVFDARPSPVLNLTHFITTAWYRRTIPRRHNAAE